MVDSAPEFEMTDGLGTTKQLAGAAGVDAVALFSPVGGAIEEIIIRCPLQTPNTKKLYWSFDNVVFHELSVGEFVGWEPRKDSANQPINQLYLKGNVAGVNYEVIANRGN